MHCSCLLSTVGWLWKIRTGSHSSIFTFSFETGRIRISTSTVPLAATSFLKRAYKFVTPQIISVHFRKCWPSGRWVFLFNEVAWHWLWL